MLHISHAEALVPGSQLSWQLEYLKHVLSASQHPVPTLEEHLGMSMTLRCCAALRAVLLLHLGEAALGGRRQRPWRSGLGTSASMVSDAAKKKKVRFIGCSCRAAACLACLTGSTVLCVRSCRPCATAGSQGSFSKGEAWVDRRRQERQEPSRVQGPGAEALDGP